MRSPLVLLVVNNEVCSPKLADDTLGKSRISRDPKGALCRLTTAISLPCRMTNLKN